MPTDVAQRPADDADPLTVFTYFAHEYLDSGSEMSDAQRALVEKAAEAGVVPFEDYEAALQAMFACFEQAGIGYTAPPPTNDRGFPVIRYMYDASDATDPIAEECMRENFEAIDTLYQMQPSSREAQGALFEAAMPQLVACLREGGYLLDVEDPSVDQVQEAILIAAENIDGLSVPEGERPFPDNCLEDAGITGF